MNLTRKPSFSDLANNTRCMANSLPVWMRKTSMLYITGPTYKDCVRNVLGIQITNLILFFKALVTLRIYV
jgi:hypothetical protein